MGGVVRPWIPDPDPIPAPLQTPEHAMQHGIAEGNEGYRVGVYGKSESNAGVYGRSKSHYAVYGWSDTNAGVFGDSQNGPGVAGSSKESYGVFGQSHHNPGVQGTSFSGRGVVGQSTNGEGVFATSQNDVGIHAIGGRLAGWFEGDVLVKGNILVTGDVSLVNAGDLAEEFELADPAHVEPGTVMVVGDEAVLYPSAEPYDKRVAGVVAGAGDYKPGIILDRLGGSRKAIALVGKVYCKVDAQYGAIQAGDLLTTSATPGHAMKAADPYQAFGAVIGKALRPHAEGKGLIPVLIALQ